MIARLKSCTLFALIFFLPIAAFADITGVVSFLTPTQGEFSIRLLSKMLGSIGNILYGEGNQLVGTLMSIINSCAVILIGVAVCFTVWDGVISAAASGEMMAHKGRKTVFMILRIVCGFCLIVPSPTTGYSLAQNGAVWVVVQGVGLANRISDRLYDYIMDGGLVFTVKPSNADDIKPYMNTGATVMKSAICMYKMQDIMIKEQKAQEEAARIAAESDMGATVVAPALKKIEEYGYSVNPDKNTITFGKKNSSYDSSNPNSGDMYGSECGKITMSVSDSIIFDRIGNNNNSPAQLEAERKVIMGYIRSGTTQMVQNVLPIAKEISALDPKSSDYATSVSNLNSRAITALMGSGISFATIMDPARNKSVAYMQEDIKGLIDDIHKSGWMYTPLLVMAPLLTEGQVISVSAYKPTTEAPNSLNESAFGHLENKDKEALFTLINLVGEQSYAFNASLLLESVVGTNPGWANIDFSKIDPYSDKDYLDDVVGTVDMILGIPRTALGYIKSFLNIGFDIAIGISNFMNLGGLAGGTIGIIGDLISGDLGGVWDGLKDTFCFGIFRDCDEKDNSISDALNGLRGMTNSLMDSIKDGLDGIVEFTRNNARDAGIGGMNSVLLEKTFTSMGPMGPMLAITMSAMVGKGIQHMQTDMFAVNQGSNALAGAVRMGGAMMKGAMDSTFEMAHVSFYMGIINMVASIGGGLLPIGDGVMKAISGVGQMVNSTISAVTAAYAGFALIFFTGGLLLYIALPLTFILNFAAASLRWLGLVFVSILAAPIFCFNLIRSDGEGLFGRGAERFLLDLGRTTLIPAILTMGAVIFMVLFSIGFMVVTSSLNLFLQVLLKLYQHEYLVPIIFGVTLLVVAMALLYMANLLANLCTHEFISGVGNALGEALTHGNHENPMHEMKQAVHGGGHQVSGAMKSTIKGAEKGGAPGGQ